MSKEICGVCFNIILVHQKCNLEHATRQLTGPIFGVNFHILEPVLTIRIRTQPLVLLDMHQIAMVFDRTLDIIRIDLLEEGAAVTLLIAEGKDLVVAITVGITGHLHLHGTSFIIEWLNNSYGAIEVTFATDHLCPAEIYIRIRAAGIRFDFQHMGNISFLKGIQIFIGTVLKDFEETLTNPRAPVEFQQQLRIKAIAIAKPKPRFILNRNFYSISSVYRVL